MPPTRRIPACPANNRTWGCQIPIVSRLLILSTPTACTAHLVHKSSITRRPQGRRLALGVLNFVREAYVPLMPFGRLVVVRLFHVAAIPQWDVVRDLAYVKPGAWGGVGSVEDVVDFFQASEGGFWVEEVDEREDDDVPGRLR